MLIASFSGLRRCGAAPECAPCNRFCVPRQSPSITSKLTMLVVSITSIPSRFQRISTTLNSILHQSVRIDKVCVYIPKHYQRFPEYDGHLPDVPDGVEVRRVEQDLGPASKILHAVSEFRQSPGTLIIYGDDDRCYPSNWAAQLTAAARQHPDTAICRSGFDVQSRGIDVDEVPQRQPRARAQKFRWSYRAQRLQQIVRERSLKARGPKPARYSSGYVDIMEGFQGVLVKPRFFDDAVFQIPQVCRPVDDIWLSATMARNQIPIWLDYNIAAGTHTDSHYCDPLCSSTFGGLGRLDLDRAAIEHCQNTYGVWPAPSTTRKKPAQAEIDMAYTRSQPI